MPEGDTVWRVARRLREALAGRPLTRCDLRTPRLATVDLTGREVLDVVPRGKHLLTRFEGGLTLHSHLRMDGAWQIYAPAERWRGGPAHQIRAILGTTEHTAVGYRLPVLDLLRTPDESRVVGHLGPDLLGPDWDPAQALGRLLSAPERPLGEALLDQRNLAGIGNVYKCELCFLLRASPWTPVGRLPRPERMPALAKKLLEANKHRPARTTTPGGNARLLSGAAAQLAPTAACGSTAGPAAPACAAAPRSAAPTRPPPPRSASPTGAPPASPTGRTPRPRTEP